MKKWKVRSRGVGVEEWRFQVWLVRVPEANSVSVSVFTQLSNPGPFLHVVRQSSSSQIRTQVVIPPEHK
jgi:hypothetical protein